MQYEPNATNFNNQLQVPIELIVSSLSPLIIESKEYLNNKGFSDQEIRNMLDEENGKDEDLILFVMSLIQAETNSPISYNLNPLFINAVQNISKFGFYHGIGNYNFKNLASCSVIQRKIIHAAHWVSSHSERKKFKMDVVNIFNQYGFLQLARISLSLSDERVAKSL